MAVQNNVQGATLTWTTNPFTVRKAAIKLPQAMTSDGKDDTDLSNTAVRTKQPGELVEFSNGTFRGFLDPAVLLTGTLPYNTNDQIKVTFADGSNITYWGFLKSMDPQEFEVDQETPVEVVGEFVVTNRNGSNVETVPAYAGS